VPYKCPVCGFAGLSDIPRTIEGGGSYEICPSCGFQFGVSDEDSGISYADWRAKWIRRGMRGSGVGMKPPKDWDPVKQLHSIQGNSF